MLDTAQLLDIRFAVAADTAVSAGGVEQPFALVDAERLRVNAGELRGNGDDVDRPRAVPVAATVPITRGAHDRHASANSCALGDWVVALAKASTAARCSSESDAGTSISTVTRRSPDVDPLVTPRPFTRKVFPDGVPGGIRKVTGSSR